MPELTAFAKFAGWWCPSCWLAMRHGRPRDAPKCPECEQPMRRAEAHVDYEETDRA